MIVAVYKRLQSDVNEKSTDNFWPLPQLCTVRYAEQLRKTII